MKHHAKKLAALLLTMAMVLSLFPAAAFAADAEIEEPVSDRNFGLINQYHVGTQAVSDAYRKGESLELNGVEVSQPIRDLPSSYDSRNYNYVTSVKNQNPYGSCWAHAAMACIESYMIKYGVPVGTGSTATTSLNLSETQHCYFNYSTAYDAEGMTNGDKCTLTSDTCLDSGGNGEMSAYTLQHWTGAASESAASALQYSNASSVASSGLNSQYCYQYNVSHVQNSEWIPGDNIAAVKQAIMDYGAGNISYYETGNAYTYSCTIDNSSQDSSSHKWANHAITVVGWDDSIAASNFKPNKPSSNGAWLCKNSWGTGYFNSGYCWISYQDTTVREGYIYFYDAEPINNYQHNYQYDGSCNVVTYGVGNRVGFANNTKVANVFTAKGNEVLRAVALCSWDEAMEYTVEIYKNPTTGNPSSGTLMTSQTGTLTYSGYYTIPLNNPVSLGAGESFAVVFTQYVPTADESGKYVHTPYDSTFNDSSLVSWANWTHVNHGNTSYYKEPNGSWTDCPDNGDYRIKAYTDDVTFTLTAVSNNTSWGTVSVSGSTITASPAAGYYVESCTVLSGTATCTINGNTITVAADSDCTVQVNFAPKPTYTVSFVASGVAEGSQTALVNDSITLPANVSTTAADWTFAGWMDHQIDETAEKPVYYAPGASYTVTGNTTLYAVYTRVEEGTGAVVYQKVSSLEDGGEYILVDSNSISGTSGYAVGNAIVTSNHYLNAVSVTVNSDNTVTATSANLPKILWKAAAASNGYTFYNENVGKYMGLDSSEYLYPSATALAWAYTSEGYMDNQSDSEGYYYLSFDTNNTRYTTNKSGKVINLYKAINDSTTYYWTDPVPAEHEHALSLVPAAAPSCLEAGNSAYYQCAVCGKCFTDAAGENEIALADTVIAALGHDYVATVTPPTETQQGYTTHVCSRCDDTYVDSYVPALGSDYPVHFSVPAGVTKPADMISNTNTGITLPTVEGPEGYSFLGWVVEDYDNVETRPAEILTGSYIAPEEITLKALFSWVDGEGAGELSYELISSAPADWTGNYVITYGTNTSMYLMKGVTISANNIDIENSNNSAAYASAGVSLSGTTLSNVAQDYVFALAPTTGSYYSIRSLSTGTYVGMSANSYLYGFTTYTATRCDWTPGVKADASSAQNAGNGSYPMLSFTPTYNYFWSGSSNTSALTSIRFWRETSNGATIYTTIIGEAHEHTPAEPVIENELAATCTAAGSYDSVVYCSECGEELSRETVTVPALGHNPGEAVQENVVPATYEAAGSYDSVVYCQRCGAELSRETVEIPMLVAELQNGYYLIGPDWTVDAINGAKLFAENPANADEYMLETTLAVGDQIKVVHVTNDAIDGWFPDGMNNHYTVDEAHAGEKTVYFKTSYQSAWSDFGGFIWIGANVTPSEPIETDALHIYSSISVGTDMIITFSVRKNDLTNYGKFWIEVVKHEPVNGDVTYVYEQDVLTENSATWTVQFNKIYAKEMGLDVDARLYVEDAAGQVYMSPARNANIRDHLGGRLTATNNIVEQRVLAADMLNYGAAAQLYMDYQTDHLVNEELTDEQLEKLHEYETKELPAADKVNSNYRPEGQSNILFNSMTLGNEVLLNLTVRLPENTGNVQLLVKEHDGGAYVATLDTTWSGSTFQTTFSGIGADKMRTEYDMVTLVDGVETGNIRTWSVEGRVVEIRNGSNELMTKLANALLTYGDSAAAYFAAQ